MDSRVYCQIAHKNDLAYNVSNCWIRFENIDNQWNPWMPLTVSLANRAKVIDSVVYGSDVNGITYMGSVLLDGVTQQKLAISTSTSNVYSLNIRSAIKICNATNDIKGFVFQPIVPSSNTTTVTTDIANNFPYASAREVFIGDAGNAVGNVWFLNAVPGNATVRPIAATAVGSNLYVSTTRNTYYKSGSNVLPTYPGSSNPQAVSLGLNIYNRGSGVPITHFDFSGDNKNYISGDTNFRNGKVKFNDGLCFGDIYSTTGEVCITKDDLTNLKNINSYVRKSDLQITANNSSITNGYVISSDPAKKYYFSNASTSAF
jgi:hypothetical protein